jgi:hypothetical protein
MSPQARKVRPGRGRSRGRPASLLLFVAVGFVVLAAILIAAGRQAGSPAPSTGSDGAAPGAGSLAVSPSSIDLGRISQAKGIVTVEALVQNSGTGDLVISEMETTCGCTRAAVVVDGAAGPWFGMRGHGAWPTGWSARLRPGKQATLRVQYDPDAHGIYRGPVDRVVFVYSDDARQPRLAVRLTGTQVP